MGHRGALLFMTPWEWGRGSPGDSGTSGLPSSSSPSSAASQWPLWEARFAARLSQDPILLELGNRAHGGSPGTSRCALGCFPPTGSPASLQLWEGKLLLFFYLPDCREVFVQSETMHIWAESIVAALRGKQFPSAAMAAHRGPAAQGLCSACPPLSVARRGSGARSQPSPAAVGAWAAVL